MIKNKKIIICIVCFLSFIIMFSNVAFALNTGVYKNIYTNDGKQSSIQDAGGYVLGIIQIVGVAVATILLLVLGIKYIMSSPEDKATIKDKASMYVVGAIIIFAASGLVGMVSQWATENVK